MVGELVCVWWLDCPANTPAVRGCDNSRRGQNLACKAGSTLDNVAGYRSQASLPGV